MSTTRRFNRLKGVSLKKEGFVVLDNGIELPIKTLSIGEELAFSIDEYIKPPIVTRRANEEEREEIKRNDPSFSGNPVIFIREYDLTDASYLEKMKELDSLKIIANIAKFIDMDYEFEMEEDGKVKKLTLWEDLGIQKGNYLEVCRWLNEELMIDTTALDDISVAVKALKGDTALERLQRFANMTKTEPMTVLKYIAEGKAAEISMKKQQLEADFAKYEQELADELAKEETIEE